jgi:hypothetical protein
MATSVDRPPADRTGRTEQARRTHVSRPHTANPAVREGRRSTARGAPCSTRPRAHALRHATGFRQGNGLGPIRGYDRGGPGTGPTGDRLCDSFTPPTRNYVGCRQWPRFTWITHCRARSTHWFVLWVAEREGVSMKVFVAGATGALGKQLVPMLVANGHDVVGMTPHGSQARPATQRRRGARGGRRAGCRRRGACRG